MWKDCERSRRWEVTLEQARAGLQLNIIVHRCYPNLEKSTDSTGPSRHLIYTKTLSNIPVPTFINHSELLKSPAPHNISSLVHLLSKRYIDLYHRKQRQFIKREALPLLPKLTHSFPLFQWAEDFLQYKVCAGAITVRIYCPFTFLATVLISLTQVYIIH